MLARFLIAARAACGRRLPRPSGHPPRARHRPLRSSERRRARALEMIGRLSRGGPLRRSPPSSSSSGSVTSTCFETMSPVRYVSRYSPNVCGSRRLTPESKTRTGSVLDVVVDDHLLRADDRRPAQLARCKPGELDVGDRLRPELHVDERDVGDIRDHAATAERGDVRRRLVQPVAEDREVVRAEIPRDAHVGLMQAEIDAARRDEVDVAELAATGSVRESC